MPHTLPPLPYAFNALEPHIDEQTMQIHHGKHHQTYVDKLNAALEPYPSYQSLSLDTLLKEVPRLPEKIRSLVRNHGGGHANHSVFWTSMRPLGGGDPSGPLSAAVQQTFGSLDTFRKNFTEAAVGIFGSGWAWLVTNGTTLSIVTYPNQDSPLQDGLKPLLGLDVWEHAYYLKYQNRRAEYVKAWWEVVNWDNVAERYKEAES